MRQQTQPSRKSPPRGDMLLQFRAFRASTAHLQSEGFDDEDDTPTPNPVQGANSKLLALAKALDGLLDHPDATVDEIGVYVALARYTDTNGLCRPSQTTIAMRLGRSRPWVNARIAALNELGAVGHMRRRQPKGGETTCQYYLPALDMRSTTAVRAVTLAASTVTPPVTAETQNLGFHENTSPSLGARVFAKQSWQKKNTTGAAQVPIPQPCINLISPTWQPSPDDIAWAQTARPDADRQDLDAFTIKFIAKINAAGGTHRQPSIKWREWLATEVFSKPAKAPGHHQRTDTAPQGEVAPTTINIIVEEELPSDLEDQTTVQVEHPVSSAPSAEASLDESRPDGVVALSTSNHTSTELIVGTGTPAAATTLPPIIEAAQRAVRREAGQPSFMMSNETARKLSEAIQPAMETLDALFTPTQPELVREFLKRFAERKRMSLPRDSLLAMDVDTISMAIPADLFAAACRNIWTRFAYRRLPEAPDFIKTVEHQIKTRTEAAAQIKAMNTRLGAKIALVDRAHSTKLIALSSPDQKEPKNGDEAR